MIFNYYVLISGNLRLRRVAGKGRGGRELQRKQKRSNQGLEYKTDTKKNFLPKKGKMVKSGRKRKKLDKAKVQLKKGTGKKSLRLPKGLNVTDARCFIFTISHLGTKKLSRFTSIVSV